MNNAISHKSKQFLLVLIKLSLLALAFVFIYHKLHKDFYRASINLIHLVKQAHFKLWKSIIFLVLLSTLNWLFEILKWKVLLRDITNLSFKNASAQTLSALTASLWTPNRVGDYGAKAMYFLPKNRKKVVIRNVFGNLAQMTITVVFGVIGVFYLSENIEWPSLSINGWWFVFLPFIVLIIWKMRGSFLAQLRKARIAFRFKQLLREQWQKVFLFSVIRYLLFSFQFYYLLNLFGTSLHYLNAMTIISAMYFFSSVLPSIFLFDILIKGSIAVLLFGFVGVSEYIVLSVVMLMWILNVVFPSILGAYYIVIYKLPKLSTC